jgi:hypothetical protein
MHKMKLIVSALTIGLAGLVLSQSATDYPNLKGDNQRTGRNGTPAPAAPGFLRNQTATQSSSLRWFRPFISTTPVESLRLNQVNPLKTIIDNTDFYPGTVINVDPALNPVGPYDPLPNEPLDPPGTQFKTLASATGTWNTPNLDEEAKFPYTLAVRRNANALNPIGFTTRNQSPRYPSHFWTPATASLGGVSQDPRQAIVPASLSTFSWKFTPHLSTFIAGNYVTSYDPTPKGYALYVWIPQGMVTPGGGRHGSRWRRLGATR